MPVTSWPAATSFGVNDAKWDAAPREAQHEHEAPLGRRQQSKREARQRRSRLYPCGERAHSSLLDASSGWLAAAMIDELISRKF